MTLTLVCDLFTFSKALFKNWQSHKPLYITSGSVELPKFGFIIVTNSELHLFPTYGPGLTHCCILVFLKDRVWQILLAETDCRVHKT